MLDHNQIYIKLEQFIINFHNSKKKVFTMESELTHSKLNMASYGFSKFLSEFIEMAFATWGFAFYESVLHLNPLWVGIGFGIFAIWNAVNDPIMGFLTNRPFKFTRR